MTAEKKGTVSSPTINRKGGRRWIYPLRREGAYAKKRRKIGWVLILLYLLVPFLEYRDLPLLRIELHRGLIYILGQVFRFHDGSYLAFLFVGAGIGLFFFTALIGRVWCGYACPQTVWLDWVIRPLEEFFEGSAAKRANADKRKMTLELYLRKGSKHLSFLFLASFLAHIFLSYFVAPEEVLEWVSSDPRENWFAFVAIGGLTGAIYFDFAWFREQFCAFLCPYARFQSVMIDEATPVVAYDYQRGEPRGKKEKGDCIDCGLCNRVCPTGIDIRQGLQLECIQCARCVDACHIVMSNLGRPTGLIREMTSMEQEKSTPQSLKQRFLRPRVMIYFALLILVFSVALMRLKNRDEIEAHVFRQQGAVYANIEGKGYSNLFQVKVINNTAKEQKWSFDVIDDRAEIICSGCGIELPRLATQTVSLVVIPKHQDTNGLNSSEPILIRLSPSQKILEFPFISPRK